MFKIKPFRQSASFCGPASLKMVLQFYGIDKTEKELAKLSGATKGKGVEADGLVKAAKKLGLKAFYKDYCEIEDIRKYFKKKIPLIVDWFSGNDGHYSVVVGIGKKNIFLQDPELGKIRKMGLEAFKRVWFDFPGNFLKAKRELVIRRLIIVHK